MNITATINQIEGNEPTEASAYYLNVRGEVIERSVLGWIEKDGKVHPVVRQEQHLVAAGDLFDDGTLYLNVRSNSGGTSTVAEAFPWIERSGQGLLFGIIGWAREHLLRGTEADQVKRWLSESHGLDAGSDIFRRAQA